MRFWWDGGGMKRSCWGFAWVWMIHLTRWNSNVKAPELSEANVKAPQPYKASVKAPKAF